ncbi:MAG TPA: sigma-70 family RNA polymerase sigma factor [Terriglobales bacterium]|nr:sigma-70 family RNA polymerase sigma factor [Terriglobales bacterium]
MSTATLWSNPRRDALLAASLLPAPPPRTRRRAQPLPVALARAPEVASAESNVQDRQLVDRCLSGDAAAWEEVVRLHSRRIYNLCLRFTGRGEDAEDLAQDVFIRLYKNLGAYRSEVGSLATWLTTLTRNLLIDHYRRAKSDRLTDPIETVNEEGVAVPLPLAASGRPADHAVWGREVHEHVQRALLRLSPELREAVILRDLHDLDYKEIAAVLRLPEGTVKSRINRGRIELARLLRPNLGFMEPRA